ncbi:MAG: pyridoxal phosphate-dependent aminotransferase [Ardenticatenaceae bacterium]|nr:pyridoxal phosphate-dependent aminotransferase [Ardenticatenaceae bacterium]
MTFDFDTEVNKFGINSTKWEFIFDADHKAKQGDHAHARHGNERMLPMWVADMDFRCPPPVVDAVVERAKRGVFGYAMPTDSYYEAVLSWFARRYGRSIQRDWIVMTPGVVPALNFMVQTYTQPGDKILIQRPVYHPFTFAIENNGREVVSNSLVLENGRYQMDFDDLAAKAADPAVKMAILCSPHNPIGRVWNREELTRFGEICLDNDVLVVSDEIHCDLIYSGVQFTSFANISERFAQNSIVCTAPSKTFNIAGLKLSNIIIPDETLRTQFNKTLERSGIMGTNTFGIVATEAAYNLGEPWLTAVLEYIEGNYQFMQTYLADHLPQLHLLPAEGTYLVWLDCRALELTPAERKKLIFEDAHLYLDEGEIFGPEGEGFERLNLACPRWLLAEAMERLKTVIREP